MTVEEPGVVQGKRSESTDLVVGRADLVSHDVVLGVLGKPFCDLVFVAFTIFHQ